MRTHPISMQRNDFVDPHDPLHPMLAVGLAGFPQVEKYPRSSINAVTRFVGGADQGQRTRFLQCAVRYRLLKPLVVAARRDIQGPAHHLDGEFASVSLDELVGESGARIA